MQDAIFLKEKAKYEKIWSKDPYRITSPGLLNLSSFFAVFGEKIKPQDSLIDFGCGTGVAAVPFLQKGLLVTLVDIARNCLNEPIEMFATLHPELLSFIEAPLWDLPDSIKVSDWIYCIDVLEHLPTEKVVPSLQSMSQKTRKGGALQVFLEDEGMGGMIGETLHLTIRPLDFWIEHIESFWRIEKVEEIIPGIRYCIYVGPGKNL